MSTNNIAKPNPDSKATMRDWEQRNTIDQLRLSLFQLTDFLNTFESSAKHKLGQLNEKVDRLERQVMHVETAISAAVEQLR